MSDFNMDPRGDRDTPPAMPTPGPRPRGARRGAFVTPPDLDEMEARARSEAEARLHAHDHSHDDGFFDPNAVPDQVSIPGGLPDQGDPFGDPNAWEPRQMPHNHSQFDGQDEVFGGHPLQGEGDLPPHDPVTGEIYPGTDHGGSFHDGSSAEYPSDSSGGYPQHEEWSPSSATPLHQEAGNEGGAEYGGTTQQTPVAGDVSSRWRGTGDGGLMRKVAPLAIVLGGIVLFLGVLYVIFKPIIHREFGTGTAGGRSFSTPISHRAPAESMSHPAPVPPEPISGPPKMSTPAVEPPSHAESLAPQKAAVLAPGAHSSPQMGSPGAATQMADNAADLRQAQAAFKALASQTVSLRSEVHSLQATVKSLVKKTANDSERYKAIEASINSLSAKTSAATTLTENAVNNIQGQFDRLKKQGTAVEPAASYPVATPAATPADRVIAGYDLRWVSASAAAVQTPSGYFTYPLGTTIPGAGVARSWKRWHGTWELVTSEGVIRPATPAASK